MLLDVLQAGEGVLRRPARPLAIEDIPGRPIQELIGHMRDTMRQAPGVGLAAPQVGIPLQIAVIEDRADILESLDPAILAETERRPVPFHVIINPAITLGEETVEFFEGCLSVARFGALVPRARYVSVDCWNERAERVHIEAAGWYARILQHEIDHLNGCLYLDRMRTRSFMTVENYGKYWKGRSVAEMRQALESEEAAGG
ncbi:MAG TPA: peptide deformylase [Bryobacteraceae bacterium]|nr:peptide deformylase [Bryobacteraceae bacterium]